MKNESLTWWSQQTKRFKLIAGSLFFGVSIMLTDEQIEIIYKALKNG